MILSFEQIQFIVKNNPQKAVIDAGKEMCNKLMLHVYGLGMDVAIKQCKHFVSDQLYVVQKQYALSNKDLFRRLLQQEDMVFSARGGSSTFGLPESDEQRMGEILSDVRYGLTLRKWIKNFALEAYRTDPMGVIFIEVDEQKSYVDNYGVMNYEEPKAYPTYKSIHCVHDYLSNGRRLEYICFQLTVSEALAFGIQDESLKNTKADLKTTFYRVVDDKKDVIVQMKETVILVTTITKPNPIANNWDKTPAFVVSDLMMFNDPRQFLSPLNFVVELADTFLQDRSVRELQKKYHGFSKPVEPLLQCSKCAGAKYIDGKDCPDCTPLGGSPTGFKLVTRPADVARFPLSVFDKENGGFDFNKIFGYVTPDIKGWEKQDTSLEDIEELMEMTYWGTVRMKRPKPGLQKQGSDNTTATEVNSNDAPKESRLNMTADWAERTEAMIADFVGDFWFSNFKKASINYSREYVMKTSDEYRTIYQDLLLKGAPDSAKDKAYTRWKHAEYANSPNELATELKKFNVEPFPHLAIVVAKTLITDFTDYNCKLYFGEWSNTIPSLKWLNTKPDALRVMLKDYVTAKGIKEPIPEPVKAPSFN